jgi:DNA-binding NarL/FixJ family response regulator
MIRILIVDDHEIVRLGLREVLSEGLKGQIEVTQAKNAKEAIELLLQGRYDIVLLDIRMPGRDGMEVLAESRRRWPVMPILVLTAYPEEMFAVHSFRLGAAGYLNKQTVSDELVTAVRRILAGGTYVTTSLAERLASRLRGSGGEQPHEALSHREMQVLRLIASGKSVKEVAGEMSLSEKTIATYRARISAKTGLNSNVEIARYALKHGLVE